MGWTGTTGRAKGVTDAEYFLAQWKEGTIFHAHGTIDRQTFYAAVETPSTPGEVWALIIMIRWGRSHGETEFMYKTMDETVGPYQTAAPLAVLDALTETTNTYALAWRDACRAHHAQRAALRGLQDGDMITFDQPLRFTNGVETDTLTIRKYGRTLRLSKGGGWLRVPGWRDQVISVTRGDVTSETPHAARLRESAYVRRVDRALRSVEHGEALRAHYGAGKYKTPEWAIRQEFRSGDLAADRIMAPESLAG